VQPSASNGNFYRRSGAGTVSRTPISCSVTIFVWSFVANRNLIIPALASAWRRYRRPTPHHNIIDNDLHNTQQQEA